MTDSTDNAALQARLADLETKLGEVEAERDSETIKRAGWELEAKTAQAALATARRDAANIARSFSCCHVPEEIAAIIAQEQEPTT